MSKLNEITNRLSSIYSQPNLPAQLYFSPTILQDELSEKIRNVHSPLNQNQTSKNKLFHSFLLNFLSSDVMKPRIIIRRIDPALILEYLKKQETEPKCIVPRKRKKSISEDDDIKSRTIALRKRKSISIIEIDEKRPKKQSKRRVNSTVIFSNTFF